MIRYGLGKPREDEGGWRRAECEVGDVVVDSTTRPADARRATAFVTDSASLARTGGGGACPRSGPRTRPAASWYASNASAPGSHSNRRGGVAVPPRHVRHLGHDVPRAVAPRSGAACAPLPPQSERPTSPSRPARRANSAAPRAG